MSRMACDARASRSGPSRRRAERALLLDSENRRSPTPSHGADHDEVLDLGVRFPRSSGYAWIHEQTLRRNIWYAYTVDARVSDVKLPPYPAVRYDGHLVPGFPGIRAGPATNVVFRRACRARIRRWPGRARGRREVSLIAVQT